MLFCACRFLAFEKTDSYKEHPPIHTSNSSSSEDSDNEDSTRGSSHSDLDTSDETRHVLIAPPFISIMHCCVPRCENSSDKRLLIILSNIQYIRSQVLPRILDCYKLHGYPEPRVVENSSMLDLKELDDVIFRKYIKCKGALISEVLNSGMGREHFDWEECPYPRAVRGYIKELIMLFIEVRDLFVWWLTNECIYRSILSATPFRGC